MHTLAYAYNYMYSRKMFNAERAYADDFLLVPHSDQIKEQHIVMQEELQMNVNMMKGQTDQVNDKLELSICS